MSVTVAKRNKIISDIAPIIKGLSDKKIFVVHRHLGSILHYDLRIQIGKHLKSWAIPKGPSMNADDRRIAIQVNDQPLSYASFRGTLADSAEVMEIWDKGECIPHSIYSPSCSDQDLLCQWREGRIRFTLKGKRLRGVFSLVRINGANSKHWLLIKGNDKYAVDIPYCCEDYISEKSRINKIITRQKPSHTLEE